MLSNVAADGLASEACDLLKKLSGCDTAVAIAGATASAAMPALLPVVALAGGQILLRRSEREDAERLDRHCEEVIRKLESLAGDVEGVAEDLTSLIQHKTWVWARISGGDQAAFADRVSRAVERHLIKLDLDNEERLEGLRIYAETVLHHVRIIDSTTRDTNDIVHKIIERQDGDIAELKSELAMRGDELFAKQQRVDELTDAVIRLQTAASSGDVEAKAALDEARAKGDAAKLQAVLVRLRDERVDAIRREMVEAVKESREIAEVAYIRGDIAEAERSLRIILKADEHDLDATNRIAHIHTLRGEMEDAEANYRHLLKIASTEEQWRAVALGNLGSLAGTRGQFHEATYLLLETLEIAQRIGKVEWQANVLSQLGTIKCHSGEFEEADKFFSKSLRIYRQVKSLAGQSVALDNLGVVAKARGDFDLAYQLHYRALELSRKANYVKLQANQLCNLGVIEMNRSNFELAEVLLGESQQISVSLQDVGGQALVLANLGVLNDQRGERGAARRLLTKSRDLYARAGMSRQVMNVQNLIDGLAAE